MIQRRCVRGRRIGAAAAAHFETSLRRRQTQPLAGCWLACEKSQQRRLDARHEQRQRDELGGRARQGAGYAMPRRHGSAACVEALGEVWV